MGKPRVITASPEHWISDGVTTHYFPTAFDRKVAQYFLDKKAYLLYGLAVDYPGLYKIPLYYREAARVALKAVGFKTSRPKVYDFVQPWAMLFFLGPKLHRSSFGTSKENATSFKIWFGKVGGLF